MRLLSANIFLIILCILNSHQLFSATATNSMTVTTTVTSTCSFSSVSNTAFGTIDGLFLTEVNVSNGSIVVVCTTGATYSIALSAGSNLSGGNRRMANASNFITYQLYTDLAHTTLWGDGTAGIGNARTGLSGSGANQTYTVYARIPTSPQTAVPPGAYTDTVTITVTF